MRRLIFTATDRPYYWERSLRSWVRVRGFEDWQPAVYLEPTDKTDTMTRIARKYGLDVHLNERRYGVLHNPWQALDAAFNDAEFVVLAEDDIVVAADILEYFNWAQQHFMDQPVLAACANTQIPRGPRGAEHEVILTDRFNPLIWGTWHDRWKNPLRDTWDHDYTSGTPQAPQSGWDWNINLRVLPQSGMKIVQPVMSRSNHIGALMGTHTTALTFPSSTSPSFLAKPPPGEFSVR